MHKNAFLKCWPTWHKGGLFELPPWGGKGAAFPFKSCPVTHVGILLTRMRVTLWAPQCILLHVTCGLQWYVRVIFICPLWELIQPSHFLHTLSNPPRAQNIHDHGHQNTLCTGFLSWVQRSSPWLHQREQGLVYRRQRLQRGFHQYEHGLLWLLQAIFNRTKGLHGHHQQDSKQNIT